MLIESQELFKELSQGTKQLILIDVRSQDEHLSGTIKNSFCIPHDEILNRLSEVPRNKEIILFCRSGRRSNQALCFLKENGYDSLKDLAGGILAWSEASLPIHKKIQG